MRGLSVRITRSKEKQAQGRPVPRETESKDGRIHGSLSTRMTKSEHFQDNESEYDRNLVLQFGMKKGRVRDRVKDDTVFEMV